MLMCNMLHRNKYTTSWWLSTSVKEMRVWLYVYIGHIKTSKFRRKVVNNNCLTVLKSHTKKWSLAFLKGCMVAANADPSNAPLKYFLTLGLEATFDSFCPTDSILLRTSSFSTDSTGERQHKLTISTMNIVNINLLQLRFMPLWILKRWIYI